MSLTVALSKGKLLAGSEQLFKRAGLPFPNGEGRKLVVPAGELRDAAQALAEEIAAKDPAVIRLAKQSLNGIDAVDVKRSYRYEQGFTFELNLAGAGDRARQAFVDNKRADGKQA